MHVADAHRSQDLLDRSWRVGDCRDKFIPKLLLPKEQAPLAATRSIDSADELCVAVVAGKSAKRSSQFPRVHSSPNLAVGNFRLPPVSRKFAA